MESVSSQPLRIVVSDVQQMLDTSRHVVAVVIQNGKLLRRVSRVMLAMGSELITCHTVPDAQRWLAGTRSSLLIYQHCENDPNSAADLATCVNSAPTLLIFDHPEHLHQTDVFNLSPPHPVGILIGRWSDNDLLRASRRLLKSDHFGVEKHLNWGAAIHSFHLRNSAQRKHVLARLEQFVGQMHCSTRTGMRVIAAAEEYLMNAFYDAPTDATGAFVNVGLPRTQVIQLPATQNVIFEFGSDGENLVIGCRDPFGSLAAEKVIASLTRCLRAGADQVQQGAGGAGLGLYLAYEHMDSVVMTVQPGRYTELLGIVAINGSRRDDAQHPKSLQLFVAAC